MLNSKKEILLIAGEESGDLHGAALVEEIIKQNSAIHFSGIGGDKMASTGVELFYHINSLSFLGFAEVIKHIPYIKKVQKTILNVLKQRQIKLVILIDYPGFNLSIAKIINKMGIRVVYYISPQIWAWGAGRIDKIRKYINKMIVFFPFENNLYLKHSVDSELVGHPLIDRFNSYKFLTKEELFNKYNISSDKEILLLMPGSRLNEITLLLPDMLKSAKMLADKFNLLPVIACSDNINEEIINEYNKDNYLILKLNTYDFMMHSKFGIIKSGTSTLEAGILCLPMVIVYKTSFLTYLIGRLVVKVKNIGLINIVAEKTIVPELIQNEANAENIYDTVKLFLTDNQKYSSVKKELSKIKEKLGSTGATNRAANIILSELNLIK